MEIESNILNILEPVLEDNSIESYQYTEHNLINDTRLNDQSNLIFDVKASDNYLIPGDSYLEFKGRLLQADNTPFAANQNITLINNAMMYLFGSIEYQIGGKTIELLRYPGQTTSILGYLTFPDDFNTNEGLSRCWSRDSTTHPNSKKYNNTPAVAANTPIAVGDFNPSENPNYNHGFSKRKDFLNSSDPRGHFTFIIPFSHIFGFSEYGKFLYNTRQTLTLTRHSDNLALYRAQNNHQDGKIVLQNISWYIPEIKIAPQSLPKVLSVIEQNKKLPISFMKRSDDCTHINHNVREHKWKVAVSAGLEKPRWVIVAFQTAKNETQLQNPAIFDHLNLKQAQLRLNTERYPAYTPNTNFTTNEYARLYYNVLKFKKDYYNYNSLISGNQISYQDFKNLFPILVFDVTRQSEQIKTGVVEMQIDFEFNEAVPQNTIAYAVILSDSVYEKEANGSNITQITK